MKTKLEQKHFPKRDNETRDPNRVRRLVSTCRQAGSAGMPRRGGGMVPGRGMDLKKRGGRENEKKSAVKTAFDRWIHLRRTVGLRGGMRSAKKNGRGEPSLKTVSNI